MWIVDLGLPEKDFVTKIIILVFIYFTNYMHRGRNFITDITDFFIIDIINIIIYERRRIYCYTASTNR